MSGLYWTLAAVFLGLTLSGLVRPRAAGVAPLTRALVTSVWLLAALLLAYAAVKL